MRWLAALMLERRRRWWLLLLLGVIYGYLARQLPVATPFLAALAGFTSVTEGLAAWLSERRQGRLDYYRAWGIQPAATSLNL